MGYPEGSSAEFSIVYADAQAGNLRDLLGDRTSYDLWHVDQTWESHTPSTTFFWNLETPAGGGGDTAFASLVRCCPSPIHSRAPVLSARADPAEVDLRGTHVDGGLRRALAGVPGRPRHARPGPYERKRRRSRSPRARACKGRGRRDNAPARHRPPRASSRPTCSSPSRALILPPARVRTAGDEAQGPVRQPDDRARGRRLQAVRVGRAARLPA